MSGVAQMVLSASNPWNPGFIGPDLKLWLDGQDSSTIVLNGSTVSQWNDKSGNGANAYQNTATNQPTYSATSFVGGYPGITFDGTNDYLRVDSTYMQGNTTHSLYWVAERVGAGSGLDTYRPWIATLDIDIGATDRGGAPHYRDPQGYGASYPYFDAPNRFNYDLNSGFTYNNNVGFVFSFQSNTTGWGVWRNGTLEGTTNGISNPNTNNIGWTLGKQLNPNRNTNCRVVEVIGTSWTDTLLRQKIEGYLAWKWGLQTSLISTHPYRNARPSV